jgi:hypothetical protein
VPVVETIATAIDKAIVSTIATVTIGREARAAPALPMGLPLP